MRRFKKMLLGAVTAVVLATGVAVSPASASVPSEGKANAEQANVPYLAWRGEHVRLGYCNLSSPPEGYVRFSGEDIISWQIEDWSGHDFGSIPVPYMTTGSSRYENGCAYARFGSQKPGVAFIKLTIISSSTGATLVDKHFLVGWMQLTDPVLTGGGPVNAGDIGCEPQIVFAERIRTDQTDPARVCPVGYDPRQLITATVKGIIPLDANFDEWVFPAGALVTPGQLTLPDDWAAWAQVAARDNVDHPNTVVPNPVPTNWDIHDSQFTPVDLLTGLPTDNHVYTNGVQCDPPEVNAVETTDTVDNCAYKQGNSGDQSGPFSTVFGERSEGLAYGPFDPIYPFATMLSDGNLDAGDAPMPAAQIDVDIAENTGTGDLGGVGYLAQVDKSVVHSRDGLGTNAAHNYDSPFYSQYLPATSRPPDGNGSPYGAVAATGVDGASTTSVTGGFSGFLHNNGYGGLYRNWDFAWETSYHPRTLSECLWYQSVFLTYEAHYRPLPYGDSSVSVYTDEHGEADAYFVPGFGFYFPGKDSNGGCDLNLVDDPLGTAHITVTARYPYQPVTIGDPSATLDYQVNSLFEKTVRALPKGGSATPNRLTRVVLAHAQDIDGSPLQYETVCWTSNNLAGGAITAFPTGPGGDLYAAYEPNGTPIGPVIAHIDPAWAHDPDHSFINAGRFCTTTDEFGNTAIEFSESEDATVNIIANWVNEAIQTDTSVTFSAAKLGELASAGPTSHVPSPSLVKAAAAATAAGNIAVGPVLADGTTVKSKVIKSAKVKKQILHKIRFARVYKPFGGKRMLQVRVSGKKGMAVLRITIKLGKTTHTYKRFVLANNTKVAVKNLQIPAKTAKVTVSLIS